VQSGQDIKVSGSDIASSQGTALDAARNVSIEAATNTHNETHLEQKRTSGLMSSGGFGITIGNRSVKSTSDTTATTAVASTVGSTQGDVIIKAGDALTQTGSKVIAPQGDVTIAARKVDIVEARNHQTTVTETQFRQSGLTVAVANPIVTAVQTAQAMGQAASNTKDPRMKALAAANTAMAAKNAIDAVIAGQGRTLNGKADQIGTGTDAAGNASSRDANVVDKLGGIQLSMSVGSAKSDSRTVVRTSDAVASSVSAGGYVRITAEGDKAHSDLTVQGSQITAGAQVNLVAEHALTLQAADNTETQTGTSSSSSASVGLILDSKGGLGVNASASQGRGNASGQDQRWTNATVNAGQQVVLQSGANTTLKGGVVSAPEVTVAAGGKLDIESLQDTSTYTSRQKQLGGSATLGTAPSANVNAAKSNIDSTYTSVTEQSGMKAGDGGFDIRVAGDTTLKGGVISSTQAAVDAKRNQFSSGGQVAATDIENHAHYQAESVSVNLGAGFSAQGKLAPSGTGVGFGKDSDSAASITHAGISGMAGNPGLSGTANGSGNPTNLGDATVRTGDKAAGIAKIFDVDKVQKEVAAQTQITQMFSTLAPKAVATYADGQIKALKEKLTTETDPKQRAAMIDEKARWDEGGRYRVLMHTAVGALVGDASGAAGAGAAGIAAPKLSELQAHLEDTLVKSGMNAEIAKGVAANVSGITAAGLGGVVGGTTGAGTALAVDANNRQLHPTEVQWIQQNAKRFAQQQKVSEQEAEKRLAQQAFRQVQFGLQGADDSQARTFLSQAKGMLESDPDCPSCGPGYMFFATPEQKLHTEMYATQVVSDPKLLEFFGKNGISQPTSEQIRASANKDASSRSKIAGATLGAAAAATSLTVPPALSWCLTNPVACNRIVIAGGEIAAGDALGPAGLGVLGTASGVKAVRSAEEVNAAMKARGWEPAWSPGTPVIESLLEPGTKLKMIVDKNGAASITEAMRSGDFSGMKLGGWGTFDDIKTFSADMRQRAAITNQFKPVSSGPFYVVEVEVQKRLDANLGFAGQQQDIATSLRGGVTQVEFLIPSINKRGDYIKPVSTPKKLEGY
jgi:filamentous hemagglutinin